MRIPDNILTALDILNKNGYEGYIVGGCVRDTLMGIAPHDYDITTNALPEDILRSFESYTTVRTGEKHGTITVIIDHEAVEITTYRIDGVYTDNRHPDCVSFTSKLKEDLSRRDFTVNAMCYNPVEGYIDMFGGIEDIKRRVIRCVGEPCDRFKEDALRILRALRFASRLGFDIEKGTAKSIHAQKELLKNISAERIWSELRGILLGSAAENILLSYSDVMSIIIPELSEIIYLDQHDPYHTYDVYTHSIKALSTSADDIYVRTALMLHDIGKRRAYAQSDDGIGHEAISSEMAKSILKRLKTDSYTGYIVPLLISEHGKEIQDSEKSVKRLLSRMTPDEARMLIGVKRADRRAHSTMADMKTNELENIERLIDTVENEKLCVTLKQLAVNGDDLKAIGIEPGKEMGRILNKLLMLVIDGEIANEKEALIDKVRNSDILNE